MKRGARIEDEEERKKRGWDKGEKEMKKKRMGAGIEDEEI